MTMLGPLLAHKGPFHPYTLPSGFIRSYLAFKNSADYETVILMSDCLLKLYIKPTSLIVRRTYYPNLLSEDVMNSELNRETIKTGNFPKIFLSGRSL